MRHYILKCIERLSEERPRRSNISFPSPLGEGLGVRLLGLLFAVFMALPTFSQDAFYIYRNDGDFNGFFFDQVQRMGYSKFDLDSVEHDVYVIQEVQTADSLDRIPLAAIDSVGFQQPEIRLNSAVRMMDDLSMTACVAASSMDAEAETGRIAFTSALPAALRPQVGDVLAGFDESVYGESGFLGKVTAVRTEGGQTVCECDFVTDWGEIFDQVITIEQIGTDAAGNVRHRVAGLKSSGNYDRTIFDWSGRLQKELYHDGPFSVNVGVDLGFTATCSTVYNISGVFDKHVFLKLVFREGFSAGASIHATMSGAHEWDIPTPLGLIPAVKFPAFFPIFQCDPAPSGFFRIGGTADMSLDLPKAEFGFSQTFVYDNKADNAWTFTWGNLDKGDDAPVLDTDGSLLGAGSTFSGFAQIGAKSNIRLENNSWLSKLLEFAIGLEIYAGPKVEASVNLDLTANNGYDYFKDSHLEFTTFSFDRELKYKWRVGRKKEERTLWSDTQKAGSITWYLLPDFLDTQAEVDNTSKQVKATVFPRRRVFATSEIGIGAIDEYRNNAIVLSRFGKEYGFREQFNEFAGVFPFSQFPYAGKYKIAPLMRLFGETFAALNEGKEIEVPPYIELSADTLTFQSEEESNTPQTITVKSNGVSVFYYQAVQEKTEWAIGQAYSIDDTPSWSWLEVSQVVTATGERRLNIRPSQSHDHSVVDRHAYVIVLATGGGEIVRDTIRITQLGTTRVPRGTRMEVNLSAIADVTAKHTVTYTGPDAQDPISEDVRPTAETALTGEVVQGLQHDDGYYSISDLTLSRTGNLLTVTGRLVGEHPVERAEQSSGSNKTWQEENGRSTDLTITAIFDVSWTEPRAVEGSIKLSTSTTKAQGSSSGSSNTWELKQTTSDEGEGTFRCTWEKNESNGYYYPTYTTTSYKRTIVSQDYTESLFNGYTNTTTERTVENHVGTGGGTGTFVNLKLPTEDSEWIYD